MKKLYQVQDNLIDKQSCTALEGIPWNVWWQRRERIKTRLNNFWYPLEPLWRDLKTEESWKINQSMGLDELDILRRKWPRGVWNIGKALQVVIVIKNDYLITMLATFYNLSKNDAPTPEEMRKNQESICWWNHRRTTERKGTTQKDNLVERRSCAANCGSVDHHSTGCTLYRQGIKKIGFSPNEKKTWKRWTNF